MMRFTVIKVLPKTLHFRDPKRFSIKIFVCSLCIPLTYLGTVSKKKNEMEHFLHTVSWKYNTKQE